MVDSLRIVNEPGREPARDVEVFVTLTHHDRFRWPHTYAEQQNLLLSNPLHGAGLTVSHVPPGFSRRVMIAVLGDPDYLQSRFRSGRRAPVETDEIAGLAGVAGLTTGQAPVLRSGQDLDVELVVTGSNFDAQTWSVKIRLDRVADDWAGDGGACFRTILSWTQQPILCEEPLAQPGLSADQPRETR